MIVVVVLSVALGVAILGVLSVAVVHLLRALGTLRAAVTTAAGKVSPLTGELQSELAVTTLETETLQRSLQTLRASRAPRRGIPRPEHADELRWPPQPRAPGSP